MKAEKNTVGRISGETKKLFSERRTVPKKSKRSRLVKGPKVKGTSLSFITDFGLKKLLRVEHSFFGTMRFVPKKIFHISSKFGFFHVSSWENADVESCGYPFGYLFGPETLIKSFHNCVVSLHM